MIRYPRSRRTHKPEQAFTLLEVAVAMIVAVVGLLPSVTLMVLARHMSAESKIQGAAYNVARQQIETLKAQSWGNRNPVTQSTFTIPSSITSEFNNQNMQGDYSIVTLSNTYPPTQQIIVRVRWTRGDAATATTSSIILDTVSAQGAGK